MLPINYIIFLLFITGFSLPTNQEALQEDYDYYDDFLFEEPDNTPNSNKNNVDIEVNKNDLSLEQIRNLCNNFDENLVILHDDQTIDCQNIESSKAAIKKREIPTNATNYTITDNGINTDNDSNIYREVETTIAPVNGTLKSANVTIDKPPVEATSGNKSTITAEINAIKAKETDITIGKHLEAINTTINATKLKETNVTIDKPVEATSGNKSTITGEINSIKAKETNVTIDKPLEAINTTINATKPGEISGNKTATFGNNSLEIGNKTVEKLPATIQSNVSLKINTNLVNKTDTEIKPENATIFSNATLQNATIPQNTTVKNETLQNPLKIGLNPKNATISEQTGTNRTNYDDDSDEPLKIDLSIPEIPEETVVKSTQFHPNNETVSEEKSMIQLTDNNGNNTNMEQPAEAVTKAGSKDTTILIFLFVAVVTVGVLAFAYNFIKKRKRQNADLERLERNSNTGTAASIKRSLQNLTKPESGQELKPLLTTPQQQQQQPAPQTQQLGNNDGNSQNGDLSENKN